MKKIILISFAFLTLLSCGSSTTSNEDTTADDVYICTGASSRKYHVSPECKGLKRCSAEIIAVTIKEAESEGKTPCKICY